MSSKLFDNADWTEASLQEIWQVIKDIAVNEFKLDFYDPYFEVVTFEEMLQIYSTSFPIMYNHWSFGKSYEELYKKYKNNRTSIAYEVIFNTSPALCYLLENNTSVMQALVMAHAAVGHSAFFKMNTFMRENTNAVTIIPFMKNMRRFVSECESKYGFKRVEQILDACISLSAYGIDRAEKPVYTNKQKESKKLKRLQEQEKDFDLLVEKLRPEEDQDKKEEKVERHEENLLKFVAKYSPGLKIWERELINMFCKVEQYFYPQRLTKTMNEGFASFWHYQLMTRLSELGYLKEGDFLEFLHSHTGVLCQHGMEHKYYRGMNPYKMGIEVFNEIKRICKDPTEEDKQYFPSLIGKNWVDEVNYAAANFRDASFIQQYLSPKLVRDFKFVNINADSTKEYNEVDACHDTEDFKKIRKLLESHYDYYSMLPYISVEGASLKGNRTLYLNIVEKRNRQVEEESLGTSLLLLKTLWPYPIRFTYTTFNGEQFKSDLKDFEG